MKIIEKEFNVITGEETISERDMTPNELKEWQIDNSNLEKQISIKNEIAAAKAALLEKLGITEEEAKLLLS